VCDDDVEEFIKVPVPLLSSALRRRCGGGRGRGRPIFIKQAVTQCFNVF